ncbi:MAG: RNase adapter RapZ [Clostridiales Family XIII bacterium]|jgi:UPF0042 nucleotide-binding protein|nr:RNase adapter RapZ [Clostridiales Family XIII bacterium]
MELVIITGISGAGKSAAANCFEDMGYYCVDNLPPSLIGDFVDLMRRSKNKISKAALVTDVRGGEFFDSALSELERLGQNTDFTILFLDASDELILRRFSESRRMHPMAIGITNAEAVAEERKKLKPIKQQADVVIDTTRLKTAELSEQIRQLFSEDADDTGFHVFVQSFGYKYGLPQDADFVFDMRFIPNPFYVTELKRLTGNDAAVSDYVFESPHAQYFLQGLLKMFTALKDAYIKEGKRSLNVAFGCTGGQHRSVAVANKYYEALNECGEDVVLKHRDVPTQ